MVGDSLGYRDHAEVACGVLGYGGCGVVGVVSNRMHYWTGSNIACGLKDAECSTEEPSLVRCKRCLPRAQKDERAANAESDEFEIKQAKRRVRKFLDEWSKIRLNSQYQIYSLHTGDEREAHLTTQDLRKLLGD